MSYRGRGRGNYYGNQNQNGHGGRNFGQKVDQFISMNAVPVEIANWNGASMEECIKFISRKCRITVSDTTLESNGNIRGYVKSDNEANQLTNWSGVKFAGKSLRISKSYGGNTTGGANGQQGSTNAIETLTQFLKSRYQAEVKMLNLSNVREDQTLNQQGFFTTISTTSKFFPALMKVASELKIEVESVDLSMNNLSDLSTISSLPQTFPKLINLSLMNNNIDKLKSFDIWKNKLNYLRELIIANNPLVTNTDANTIKADLARIFPRLIIINGDIIRNENVLLANLKFAFGNPQQMFFQDQEIQQMSTNFVTNFYNLWDTRRGELMQLYQNESQFSVSVDMANPHSISNHNIDFGYYLPLSRNLTKISAPKIKVAKLFVGQSDIFKSFQQLPKLKHELINKPQLFNMEVFRFEPLNGIVINLHGTFQELAPPEEASHPGGPKKFTRPKRIPLSSKGFDRCFIVVPGHDGSMIIASDSLIIRNPTEANFADFRPTPQTVSTVPESVQVPVPTTASSVTINELPPDIKSMININQQELLVKIVVETHLNLQYAFMLCEQSNWDYQQCTVNFKNSVATLPAEAYR